MTATASSRLALEPLEPFGAVIAGLDLRETPAADLTAALLAAVVEHGVVFLHDQALSDDEQLALAGCFGTLSVYPILAAAGEDVPLEFIEDTADDPPKADRWHTDLTWLRPREGLAPASAPALAGRRLRVAKAFGEPVREEDLA